METVRPRSGREAGLR